MSNLTEPARRNFDMNALFDTTSQLNDMSNMGNMIGNMVGNMVNGGNNQPQYFDPNSRINNNNPYGNPYQQQYDQYQPTNYGYGYGDHVMGTGSMSVMNGMVPGISNPNYGM